MIKINLLKYKYKCLFDECVEHRLQFKHAQDLGNHIRIFHKMSKLEYSKHFNTPELVKCFICGEELYRVIDKIKFENNIPIVACTRHRGKLANLRGTKTKKEKGMFKEITKKANRTKQIRNSNTIGAKKAATTKKNNGYYGSLEHKKTLKNWIAAGQNAAKTEEVRNKARNTCLKKFGKRITFVPSYSLESQELFRILEKFCDECYFATKNYEFQVYNKKHIFLDFYIPSSNKIIEFDEEYHNNKKQHQKDIVRENLIKSAIENVQILRITKEEFLEDKELTVRKCLDFIK